MAAPAREAADEAPLHPRTIRPTRLVVAGDAATRPTAATQPVAIVPGPPAVSRRRLVRDVGGVLLGAASVLLLAVALVPGGGVLGTSAEPRSPAGVTSGQTPPADRSGEPAPTPGGSRLAPLASLPGEPTAGTSATTSQLPTPSATPRATERPGAPPTARPPTPSPAPTARPTAPPTLAPTPAPTPPPTAAPTPAAPSPDPTPPPPTPDPMPDPTPAPTPDLLPSIPLP